MKSAREGRLNRIYAAIIVSICLILILTIVIIASYHFESVHPLKISDHSAVASLPLAVPEREQEHEANVAATVNTADSATWTFMVYINADYSALEEDAISDFMEMANIGSTDKINIVVQFDRIPGYNDSYDDWTDCRRFLVTKGITPDEGNEVLDIGEVNMGDPANLVNFAEWAASTYPAEKYALILSSHGMGWDGCCWDDTSGDDSLTLPEIQSALSDISGFIGRPIDLMGFDACLMGMIEVAYEIHDYASVLVASEHAEPSSGWPYDSILTQLSETPEIDSTQFATVIVACYYTSHAPTGYTMAAIDMTKIDTVVSSSSDLSQALAAYNDTDTQSIKEYAQTVISALNEAVIYERHRDKWPGTHGLAVYFPKDQEAFDSLYNIETVSFADATAWDKFLLGYFTSSGDSWITAAREETQEYYIKDHIDLYDFCQHLIDIEL